MAVWSIRLLVLFTVAALMFLSQRYWIVRTRRLIAAMQPSRLRSVLRIVWTVAAWFIALVFLERIVSAFIPPLRHYKFGHWGSIILGLWFASSLVSYLAIKAVRGVERLWIAARSVITPRPQHPTGESASAPANPSRREFFRLATYAAGALPFAAALYGFADERFNFTIRKQDVPIAGLPRALDGLRIAQLSDIHISSYMPASEIRRAVEMANGLSPDLMVVTGDLLTGRGDPLHECVAELSRLRAPLGVWGCNGNHEIYADAEDAAEQLFRQYGMTMLRQRNAQVTWRGANFNLIGVDYQRERDWSGKRLTMLTEVEPLVRRDMPNILLSHNPNAFPRASELGIELTLAGHTHGGQVKVEILDHRISPAKFITDYPAGLYQRPLASDGSLTATARRAALYVNRGLGTIGTPIRLGVPPEITLLTLRSA